MVPFDSQTEDEDKRIFSLACHQQHGAGFAPNPSGGRGYRDENIQKSDTLGQFGFVVFDVSIDKSMMGICERKEEWFTRRRGVAKMTKQLNSFLCGFA